MKIIDTGLPGIKILEPQVFSDERGFFYESFNQQQFNQAIGREVNFVQDNHSRSVQGVLRGLHFQRAPHAQAKLIRVIYGEVFDVAVDIRLKSPTYGQWYGECISAENKRQIWIPEGFAHGFLVLSSVAEFLYKTTDYWHPELECTINWNDPEIGIDWPLTDCTQLSKKDHHGCKLSEVF